MIRHIFFCLQTHTYLSVSCPRLIHLTYFAVTLDWTDETWRKPQSYKTNTHLSSSFLPVLVSPLTTEKFLGQPWKVTTNLCRSVARFASNQNLDTPSPEVVTFRALPLLLSSPFFLCSLTVPLVLNHSSWLYGIMPPHPPAYYHYSFTPKWLWSGGTAVNLSLVPPQSRLPKSREAKRRKSLFWEGFFFTSDELLCIITSHRMDRVESTDIVKLQLMRAKH